MKTVSMTQLRAVPLTLEIPPLLRGWMDISRTILYPGHKLMVTEGEMCWPKPSRHKRGGCEAVPQLGSLFSKPHTSLLKVSRKLSVLMEAYWLTDPVSPRRETKWCDFCPNDNDCNESAKHWCVPAISSALWALPHPNKTVWVTYSIRVFPAAHADWQFLFGFWPFSMRKWGECPWSVSHKKFKRSLQCI